MDTSSAHDSTAPGDGEVYFRLPDLQRRYGNVSKPTIYRAIERGELPKGIRMFPGCQVWPLSALQRYEAERARETAA